MLKIRLQRIGRRHDPQFRVVVIDGRRGPKSGKFIEIVGNYNAKAGEVNLDADRIKYWVGVGAQPSDTVHNFCITQGILEGKKINALPKKTPIIDEEAIAAEKEAAAAKEAEEAAAAEAAASEEATEEAPEPDSAEAPAEEAKEEEAPVEEVSEEAPTEESEAADATPDEEEKTEEAEA